MTGGVVVGFQPRDAILGVESYRLGQVSKVFCPFVDWADYRIASCASFRCKRWNPGAYAAMLQRNTENRCNNRLAGA
jgi:hypothetical protein